ncbi:50S ribosomal protein L33 [Cohnella fermenti]|uniref:50S ribosomal protein L33 n=1 Tax=Cohnella fermenti TaxID=2565925 RepID=A0A4S4BFN5_9BACL|nr:50S ribosomal protein L33 [Cohnella fermenti]THF73162.1 50S ribosomal protein L33 [Cohnella fermenti]
MAQVTREQVVRLVGKTVYAKRKDGSVVSGKLVRISGNKLILEASGGKKARTKAIIPLVLFDLLAIGTTPYGWGGGGFGGFGGYGGFGGWGGGWW